MGENLVNREPNLLSLFMQMESIQFRYLRHKHSQQAPGGQDSQVSRLPPSQAQEDD